MAWEVRGERPYYYKSVREGAKIRKVYIGSGHVAQKAAMDAAAAKAERGADQAAFADIQAQLAGVDQLTADAAQGVDLLVKASLRVLGFHERRGEWRRGT